MVHDYDLEIGILLVQDQGKVFLQLIEFVPGTDHYRYAFHFFSRRGFLVPGEFQEEESIIEKLNDEEENEDQKEDNIGFIGCKKTIRHLTSFKWNEQQKYSY
jgi:hypothetical protein